MLYPGFKGMQCSVYSEEALDDLAMYMLRGVNCAYDNIALCPFIAQGLHRFSNSAKLSRTTTRTSTTTSTSTGNNYITTTIEYG